MDRELMIKMGWSRDLIESVLKMQKALDEHAKYSFDSAAHVQSSISLYASTIDTTNLVPVAGNEIRVNK